MPLTATSSWILPLQTYGVEGEQDGVTRERT
jgi:hypothetical protein